MGRILNCSLGMVQIDRGGRETCLGSYAPGVAWVLVSPPCQYPKLLCTIQVEADPEPAGPKDVFIEDLEKAWLRFVIDLIILKVVASGI